MKHVWIILLMLLMACAPQKPIASTQRVPVKSALAVSIAPPAQSSGVQFTYNAPMTHPWLQISTDMVNWQNVSNGFFQVITNANGSIEWKVPQDQPWAFFRVVGQTP